MLDSPVITALFQPAGGGKVQKGEGHMLTVLEVASDTSAYMLLART